MRIETKYGRIKQCRHGVFAFLKNDITIGRSMDRYGEWCESELRILLRYIRRGDSIIDVGSNIGTHTIPFAKKVGIKGCVYAFEPQRLIASVLHTNLMLNDLYNVRVVPCAASNTEQKAQMPLWMPDSKRNFGRNSLSEICDAMSEVDCKKIDSLDLQACRLIKIDVEGHEQKVLEGALDTIHRCRPLLWVENNDEEKSEALIRTIIQVGYDLYWHFSSRFNNRNYFKSKKNIFEGIAMPSVNMLCVPANEKIDIRDDLKLLEVQDAEQGILDAWELWKDKYDA